VPRFQVHKEGDGFVIDTNINFLVLNAEYKRHNPDRSLSPALVLDLLYEGFAEVDFLQQP